MFDILYAIELIEKFIFEVNDFDEYSSDKKTQSAVERQLEIIGEAVNKYRQINSDHKLTNVNEIVGLRNRLIHFEYSMI